MIRKLIFVTNIMTPFKLVLVIALVLILIFILKIDFKWAALVGGILIMMDLNDNVKTNDKIENIEAEQAKNMQEKAEIEEAIAVLEVEESKSDGKRLTDDEINERKRSLELELATLKGEEIKNEEYKEELSQ